MTDVTLFNNCKGRPHSTLFGSGAFFDLNTDGRQAEQATDLRVGSICIVAQQPDDRNRVRFDRCSFTSERIMPDPDSGNDVRVLFGELLDSETLAKADAARHPVYSDLFNVKGHFKQTAVV